MIELLIEPFDAARPPRLVNEFRWNGREPVTWTTTLDGRELLDRDRSLPSASLVIFGGGADVEPVARIAEAVGWRVAVIRRATCIPRRSRRRSTSARSTPR